MTEDELFKAVHAYAAHLDDHGPDLTESEARAKLLEAIEAYAVAKELLTHEDMTRDDVIAWARRVQLLEAKAAVSDAYLLVCEATDWEHRAPDQSRRKDLSIAVKALRELESK